MISFIYLNILYGKLDRENARALVKECRKEIRRKCGVRKASIASPLRQRTELSIIYAELSLYELNRQPQLPVNDSDLIVMPKTLRSEMMCPICLDVLKTTMTTKEVRNRRRISAISSRFFSVFTDFVKNAL